MVVPIVITALIDIVAVCGDKLLTKVDHCVFKAFIDTTTHGLIGLFSWAAVVFSSNSIHNIKFSHCAEILLSGAFASLIDLDHFLAARSLRLQDALHLSRRPPFHSSSLLILVFFLFHLCGKKRFIIARFLIYSNVSLLNLSYLLGVLMVFKSSLLNQIGWIIFVAGGSHHLRDGVRRGLWFPPFGSTPPLHYVLYLGSLAIFPHVVVFFMPNLLIPKKTRYIIV